MKFSRNITIFVNNNREKPSCFDQKLFAAAGHHLDKVNHSGDKSKHQSCCVPWQPCSPPTDLKQSVRDSGLWLTLDSRQELGTLSRAVRTERTYADGSS